MPPSSHLAHSLCETGKLFTVKVRSRHVVTIGDTTDAGTYAGGGRLVQVKQPKQMAFKPLAEALESPEILDTQADSPKRLRTVHACFACADAVLPHPSAPPIAQSDEEVDATCAALHGAIEMSSLVKEGQVRNAARLLSRTCPGGNGLCC